MELSGFQVEERTFLRRLDLNFIIVIVALNIIGLINLFSATHGPASREVAPLFVNQIVWLGIGWSIFFLMTILDYAIAVKLAWAVYALNLGALIFTTFFGKVALGAQRWIDLGFFRYQPSETMKLAVILILTRVLANRNPSSDSGMGLRDLLIPLAVLLIPFGFIVEQPDLGTAMMMAMIGCAMIIFTKVKRSLLIFAVTVACAGAWGAWSFVLRDYQKNRVLTFLSPETDPLKTGYNSIQSKIAVGSGKFFGKGFRKGTQSQLEFLPERHTDFIFSVLSEEHGFVGSLTTIGLFCLLYIMIIRIAINAKDKLGALVCVGVLSYVFFHMIINVGMVIGLLPIVGVPLPLLSYGGTSMLTTMAGLGMISSVAFRRYLF